MSEVKIRFAIDTSAFKKALDAVAGALARFDARIQKLGTAMGKKLFSTAASAAKSLVAGLANITRVAGAAAAAVAGIVLSSSITEAAQMEVTRMALEQFTGSAVQAKAILEELNQISALTGIEDQDLEATATGLLRVGMEAEQAMAVLQSLSAVAGSGDQLRGLGVAMSKVFSKGAMDAKGMNAFLAEQINLYPALAQVTGLQGDALNEAISGGQIRFEHLAAAVAALSGSGGEFFGMMEKKAGTTIGLWKQIQGAVTSLKKKFGEPINDAIKPILRDVLALAESLTAHAAEYGKKIASAFEVIHGAFQTLSRGELYELIQTGLTLAFARSVDYLATAFGAVLPKIGQAFLIVFGEAMKPFKALAQADFWKAMGFALLALAESFVSVIQRGIASLLRMLADKAPPWAKKWLGDAAGMAEGGADASNNAALAWEDKRAQAADNLDKTLNADGTIGDRIAQLFAGKGIDELQGRFDEILATIQERVGDQAAPGGPAGPVPRSTPVPEPLAEMGGTKLAKIGEFGAAMNTLFGRTANELIAVEAKKQSGIQEKMLKQLEKLNGGGKAGAKPGSTVQVLSPRFI